MCGCVCDAVLDKCREAVAVAHALFPRVGALRFAVLVKWQGYGSDENTWEPLTSFVGGENGPEVLKYWNSKKKNKPRGKRKANSRRGTAKNRKKKSAKRGAKGADAKAKKDTLVDVQEKLIRSQSKLISALQKKAKGEGGRNVKREITKLEKKVRWVSAPLLSCLTSL